MRSPRWVQRIVLGVVTEEIERRARSEVVERQLDDLVSAIAKRQAVDWVGTPNLQGLRAEIRSEVNAMWVAADKPFVQSLRELVDERDRASRGDEQPVPPVVVSDRRQEAGALPLGELAEQLANRITIAVRDLVRGAVVDELRRHNSSPSSVGSTPSVGDGRGSAPSEGSGADS